MQIQEDKIKLDEEKIDSYSGEMGLDMVAMLALNARQTAADWKANRFIQEFSAGLGFTHYIDTAVRIIKYLYPENRTYWITWDKRYLDRVKGSPWIKYNLKTA